MKFNGLNRLFCFCALWAVNADAEPQRLPWQSVDYLISSFIEIALRSEYDEGPSAVRKWNKPIHYVIEHRVGDQELHQRLSTLHLAHLAAITGLSITPVTNKIEANLQIIFSAESKMMKELQNDLLVNSQKQRQVLFHDSVCLAHLETSGTGDIVRAIILIPVDRARQHAKLFSCIVEELTQVLGLPNDSDKVFPSIFNDRSVDNLLTGLDYLLLKMLYDPRVKTGMTEAEVMPILRTIAMEFKAGHRFESADRDVRKTELYELLN